MKRFVEGQSRTQGALLPETLDDFVAEANPVRVIEVFVEELDLRKLGFAGVDPTVTGRPAYHPGAMLKLYIYVTVRATPSPGGAGGFRDRRRA